MKKRYLFVSIAILIVGGFMIFSYFQPPIIEGQSSNWKIKYEPRKGDEADSEKFPWTGTIKWKKPGEIKLIKLEQIVGEKTYPLFDGDMLKKGEGNFDGKTLTDSETYYNPPRKTELKQSTYYKIIWVKDGKKISEKIKLQWKKRFFVKPLF
ncbi:hypothetical protein [Listeria valentina]|uniref:hypothetical protein n=1 Tax=Listeria valentina TaxID=2705293 RepID=UPI001431D9A2|nr:hypothetical protein [Listeria valentina]